MQQFYDILYGAREIGLSRHIFNDISNSCFMHVHVSVDTRKELLMV